MGVGGSINEAQQSFTCIGRMLSAANNTTRASLTSWWELKTHWTKRLGSQLWLINLATLPYNPASIQNSGPVSDIWSFLSLAWLLEGIDTSRNRLCKKFILKKKKSKIKNRGIFWNYIKSDLTWCLYKIANNHIELATIYSLFFFFFAKERKYKGNSRERERQTERIIVVILFNYRATLYYFPYKYKD